MQRLLKEIQNYLEKNFGNKTFVYDQSVPDDESSDVWGFKAIKILVVEENGIVRYRVTASK